MIPPYDFATRLRLAREMLARHGPTLPVHLADQFAAAADETRLLHDHIGLLLPLLHPERAWHQRIEADASDEVRAYLIAGVVGCTTFRCHLKRGGPQPVFVRLPLHRADCGRCVQTLRRPPAGEDDRCDLCGTRGVVTFVPFAVRQGPLLIAGDVCRTCAEALGVALEVGA